MRIKGYEISNGCNLRLILRPPFSLLTPSDARRSSSYQFVYVNIWKGRERTWIGTTSLIANKHIKHQKCSLFFCSLCGGLSPDIRMSESLSVTRRSFPPPCFTGCLMLACLSGELCALFAVLCIGYLNDIRPEEHR